MQTHTNCVKDHCLSSVCCGDINCLESHCDSSFFWGQKSPLLKLLNLMTKKTWTWFMACVGVRVQVRQYGLKARVSLQEKNVSKCNVV